MNFFSRIMKYIVLYTYQYTKPFRLSLTGNKTVLTVIYSTSTLFDPTVILGEKVKNLLKDVHG